MFNHISKDNPVIAWWSGGVDSALACKLALDWWGKDCVVVIFIDTRNEDDDTVRFMYDCERWYGVTIYRISSKKWDNIQEVWEHYLSLNVATGAICSTELKRVVRQDFQMKNNFSHQVFGFDADEIRRAKNMKRNYPDSKPIFPLIYEMYKKGEALKVLQKNGIEPPLSYRMGYSNNNCLKTGCVKGGIGYWQKFQKDFPDRFDRMAEMEHKLTNEKGEPVTICKDQSKGGGLVFLKPHPDYPNIKDISMMKGRMAEPLMECNGFCGVKDATHHR
ncbi:MAG: hypothetical protein H6550_16000 [Chitinophagales bacterium]|nr:hypothetical protein [Chitinophagales bacterium]